MNVECGRASCCDQPLIPVWLLGFLASRFAYSRHQQNNILVPFCMPTSSMGLVFCILSHIHVIFLNNCKAKTQNTWMVWGTIKDFATKKETSTQRAKKKGANKLPRGGFCLPSNCRNWSKKRTESQVKALPGYLVSRSQGYFPSNWNNTWKIEV